MKPPLSARQRAGAWIAGAVGYSLWASGSLLAFGILTLLLGTLVFGAFFGGISLLFGGEDGLADFGDDVPVGIDVLAWTALIVAVVGVAMLVFGVLASGWILRGFGVARPTGVTWASIGIAAIPNLTIFWLVVFPLVTSLDLDTTTSVVLVVLFDAIVAALIGALVWWWMSHAQRSAASLTPPA